MPKGSRVSCYLHLTQSLRYPRLQLGSFFKLLLFLDQLKKQHKNANQAESGGGSNERISSRLMAAGFGGFQPDWGSDRSPWASECRFWSWEAGRGRGKRENWWKGKHWRPVTLLLLDKVLGAAGGWRLSLFFSLFSFFFGSADWLRQHLSPFHPSSRPRCFTAVCWTPGHLLRTQ